MSDPLAIRVTPNVTCTVMVEDPAFVACDALARPVNEGLRATTSLGRRLEDAAGAGMIDGLRVREPLGVGAAVVTSGGELEAKLVIHAVVMTREERVSRRGVALATTSVLQRATDWGVRSIAMVPFGLGAGNLDVESSADAMLEGVRGWRGRDGTLVSLTLIVENEEEADAFTRALRPVAGAIA